MNDIINLLGLEDYDLEVTKTEIIGRQKILSMKTRAVPQFCPLCESRMYSKGVRTRTIHHPILQDNYQLIIKLKQRRWRCTNPLCRYETDEHFRFVDRYRRMSNAADLLIVDSFRKLETSASSIAEKFHTSDTNVLNIFDRFVDMKRLPLTDAISVDEVHLDMDPYCKYALVIQDFHTSDPIDLIQSRRNNVTEPYFASIPAAERNSVKYLISDMYNPYIAYVDKYFPNAVSVVDSFHVMQWIVRELDNFIRKLIKSFKARDEQRYRERTGDYAFDSDRPVHIPISDEVYLLQKYRWLLLSNVENMVYHTEPRYDNHFKCHMDTYSYDTKFFALHPHMKDYRELKEYYARFNLRNAGNPTTAAIEIESLIDLYLNSGYDIFRRFGMLLIKYKEPIINSFVMVERIGPGGIYDSRLSNGPIESINRKTKDLKRTGRGFRNFEHMRNRFLFATRKNPSIIGY